MMLYSLQRGDVSFKNNHSAINANTHKTKIWKKGRLCIVLETHIKVLLLKYSLSIAFIWIKTNWFIICCQDLASLKTSLDSYGKVQDVQGASGESEFRAFLLLMLY